MPEFFTLLALQTLPLFFSCSRCQTLAEEHLLHLETGPELDEETAVIVTDTVLAAASDFFSLPFPLLSILFTEEPDDVIDLAVDKVSRKAKSSSTDKSDLSNILRSSVLMSFYKPF